MTTRKDTPSQVSAVFSTPGSAIMTRRLWRNILTVAVLAPAILPPWKGLADSLDDLLRPQVKASSLNDDRAAEAWRAVVDAFRKNDMAEAVQLGNAFLSGDFKPSAYQLLGVKVMIGLARGTAGDETFDDPVRIEEKKRLEAEREELKRRWQEAAAILNPATARVNQITMNGKRTVQIGSANYYETVSLMRKMDVARDTMNELKEPIELNKKKTAELASESVGGIKTATLRLLDMLLEAGEIEAAFAVANTYIQKIGNDLDIAKKQQDVARLERVAEKATKIVALLEQEVHPLVDKKLYWEAKDVTETLVNRVALEGESDLIRLVKSKVALGGLGVEKAIRSAQTSVSAIERQAQTDYRKAYDLFDGFKAAYPDYPEMQALSVTLAQRRDEQMDQKLEDLVTEVEELAISNPERALDILPVLDKEGFDPLDRVKLEVRIKNVHTKVIGSSIDKIAADLEEVKGRFDPVALIAVLKTRRSTESLKVGLAPADLRLVKARLKGLLIAIEGTGKLEPSPEQHTNLMALKSEVDSLHNSL